MTDKEFKHLGKSELIRIIYQQKKNEDALRAELQRVNEKLQFNEMQFEKVGSFAEAALPVNDVFAQTQKAADEYMTQLHSKHGNIEKQCADMLAQTEERCRAREEETAKRIDAAWLTFTEKAQELIRAHNEFFSYTETNSQN